MKRFDFLGIAFVIASVLFCYYGLNRMQSNTEDVLQWLPDQSEARDEFNFFEERFGSDDFLIITWSGCTVDDPRLTAFAQAMQDHDIDGLIQSVTTGVDVTQRLESRMKISPENTARRLQGIFFGIADKNLTCATVELSLKGMASRHDSLNLLWEVVEATPGLERDDVSLGGYPYIATYIDHQLNHSFRFLLIPSILLATFIALLCLRHAVLTLIVFVTAVGAAMVSVALIPVCGGKMGGLMSIIPALVFVLTTSGSIHLVRYGLAVGGGEKDTWRFSARKLLAIGWKPCTISTATTAVGMLSLTRSEFPAIRNFGLYCATGVGVALVFQLIVVPWLLDRFGESGLKHLGSRRLGPWSQLMDFIGRHRTWVTLASLTLMVLGAVGLTRLKASVEVEKLFRPNSEILVSLRNMDRQLGPMDQTELLLVFEEADSEDFPDRVRFVRRVQAALMRTPRINVTHSLINYLPNEPDKSNVRSFARRSTYGSLLRRERESLSNSHFLFIENGTETWRISLRFPFTSEVDFDLIAKDVKEASQLAIQQATAASEQTQSVSFQEPVVIYTGKTHLFNHAQQTLLVDLFQNFLLAFVIITPMLMIVLRSFWLGLIAMLPNVFPTLVVFGGLGWLGLPVDLAIAMTASVALGIAVDDTTHFLVRFRDFGGSLKNVTGPIHQTIRQCGPAMLATTLIASGGLMVYSFSQMLVVTRFAWSICLLLVIALLADVIMLPAILFLVGKQEPKKQTELEKQMEMDAETKPEVSQ